MHESRFSQFSWQASGAGFLAAFVGFAGSFAVVLQGLHGAGADNAQAGSGLLFLSIAAGLSGIVLSWRTRMPVAVAWSTPGAALLATSALPADGYATAIGAYLVSGIAYIAIGGWRPLGRAIAAIPPHLANAMLGGVLLQLCFAPFHALAELPLLATPILLAWVVGGLFNRLLAVPLAVVAFAVVVAVETPMDTVVISSWLPDAVWVTPEFSWSAILNISVPLILVTMASQNISGAAVLRSFGYKPNAGPLIATTGVGTALSAPFGAHSINLAALTAALCAGEDAHADPGRRYWAGIFNGIALVWLGLCSTIVIALVSLAPALLLQAIAGLALMSAFCNATFAAFAQPHTREASAITFLMTASGIAIVGISGAFWGLLIGAAYGAARTRFVSTA